MQITAPLMVEVAPSRNPSVAYASTRFAAAGWSPILKKSIPARSASWALAEAGFVVAAFDASFQGDSGGDPRQVEDAGFRVSDFSFVIDYLVTQPFVDADKIGVLAICGGAGYAVAATKIDRRIKALGTVVGSNVGRLMREGFSDYDPMGMLEAIAAQRTAEARGQAEQQINDLLPPSPDAAKEAGVTDIDIVEAAEYYKTPRGQKPGGKTSFNFAPQANLADWDAYDRVEVFLTQPLCVVIGDKVGAFASQRLSMELYGRAASKDKQLVVVEGASHYDLYEQPGPTKKALEDLVPFYRKHLG